MFQSERVWRSVCLAGCLLLASCTVLPLSEESVKFDSVELLDGGLFGVGAGNKPAPVALTRTNEEMRAFLKERVPSHLGKEEKVERILHAILEDGLRLDYDNFKTYTAEEAFYRREGNCLSFTNLFIALAREAGLKVSYQEVQVPPNWERRNETYFYNRHINALVFLPYRGQKAVDFNISEFDTDYQRRSISDNYALAQYFNNMGVHWLEEQHYATAFVYLREAIRLQPRASYFWTNMGSLYSRAGYPARAESAWLEALQRSEDPSALGNLARYYGTIGREDLADWYAERVEGYQRQNPYYLYKLARSAYERKEYNESLAWLRQSLKLREDEHRFYRLQGLAELKLGKPERARQSFGLAERYASSDHERRVYNHKQRLIVQVSQ
jgi:Flp pilus assembly protein TadD